MKFVQAFLLIFAILAASCPAAFSQEGAAAMEPYAAEVYRGSSPPSDELIVARIVWELKNKKGTIQEAMNDDTAKRLRVFVRGTHKVSDQHFYVFINGDTDLCRAEMFRLGNEIWVLEKPEWLISHFAESLGGLGSSLNGFMTVFSK